MRCPLSQLLFPCYDAPELEAAFKDDRFNKSETTTVVILAGLTLLHMIWLFLAKDDMHQRRLYPLIICLIFLGGLRLRLSRSCNQERAHVLFAWAAAWATMITLPTAKVRRPRNPLPLLPCLLTQRSSSNRTRASQLLCPSEPNMSPLLQAGMLLIATAVGRHVHLPTKPRILINTTLVVVDMAGSRLLICTALLLGEVLGATFEHDLRATFVQQHEQQRRGEHERAQLQAEGARLLQEQRRIVECLRESNERREYEVRMMQHAYLKALGVTLGAEEDPTPLIVCGEPACLVPASEPPMHARASGEGAVGYSAGGHASSQLARPTQLFTEDACASEMAPEAASEMALGAEADWFHPDNHPDGYDCGLGGTTGGACDRRPGGLWTLHADAATPFSADEEDDASSMPSTSANGVAMGVASSHVNSHHTAKAGTVPFVPDLLSFEQTHLLAAPPHAAAPPTRKGGVSWLRTVRRRLTARA